MDVEIPVWKAEVPMEAELEQIMVTTEDGYSIMPIRVPVENGQLRMSMRPFSAVVLKHDI